MKPICKGTSLILWGRCTSGPRVHTFDSGKIKTTFSICYHQQKNENGEKISEYIDVEAWNALGQYAACIERGDDLLVAGDYLRDNYRSEKKGEDVYVLRAAIILPQPVVDEMPEDAETEELPEEWTKPQGGAGGSYAEQIEAADGELPY